MDTGSRGREFVRLLREEQVLFLAAGIGFYAIASVVPLVLIALASLSALGATDRLIVVLHGRFGGTTESLLRDLLEPTRGRDLASGLGFLVLLWSGSRIFRGISVAFAQLYGEEADRSFLETATKGFLMLALLLFAVVVLLATGFLRAFTAIPVPLPDLAWAGAAVLGLVAGLLPLYYVMPPHEVCLPAAVPGACLTAVGWVGMLFAVSSYLRHAGAYAAYGVLGGFLVLVSVVYAGAVVFLLGATLNVVLEA